jgi:hypothetical protein
MPANFSRIAGWAMTFSTAALMRSTISRGVPAGAMRPVTLVASKAA